MGAKRTLGIAVGLAVWTVYFYGVDFFLMQVQGLPVAMDLMPK